MIHLWQPKVYPLFMLISLQHLQILTSSANHLTWGGIRSETLETTRLPNIEYRYYATNYFQIILFKSFRQKSSEIKDPQTVEIILSMKASCPVRRSLSRPPSGHCLAVSHGPLLLIVRNTAARQTSFHPALWMSSWRSCTCWTTTSPPLTVTPHALQLSMILTKSNLKLLPTESSSWFSQKKSQYQNLSFNTLSFLF